MSADTKPGSWGYFDPDPKAHGLQSEAKPGEVVVGRPIYLGASRASIGNDEEFQSRAFKFIDPALRDLTEGHTQGFGKISYPPSDVRGVLVRRSGLTGRCKEARAVIDWGNSRVFVLATPK